MGSPENVAMSEATYDPSKLYSQRVAKTKPSFVRRLVSLLQEVPGVISFGGGFPPPELMPLEEMARFKLPLTLPDNKSEREEVLERLSREWGFRPPTDWATACQYSASGGARFFIEDAIPFMKKLTGVKYKPEEILITNGGQEALVIAGLTFINPWDVVYTYQETYVGFIPIVDMMGGVRRHMPIDDRGILIEPLREDLASTDPNPESKVQVAFSGTLEEMKGELERIMESLTPQRRGKMLYINALYDNPGQTVLEYGRARELVELALEYNLLILQDEPYGECGKLSGIRPYMSRIAREEHGIDPTITSVTFSKIADPALRVAINAGPRAYIDKLKDVKGGVSLCTSALGQAYASFLIRVINWDERFRELREGYDRKRAVFLDALRQSPELYSLVEKIREGPLFVHITFRQEHNGQPIDVSAMFSPENIRNYLVAAVPGSECGGARNTVRVNHGLPSEAEIREGVGRWNRLVKDMYFS